jgi:hypothetical protein
MSRLRKSSSACITPDVLPGKHRAEIHLLCLETDPPAVGHRDRLFVEAEGELKAAIDAR